jgi:hypothetical protein
MLDAGCWMLDAGCWILDAGCWMRLWGRITPFPGLGKGAGVWGIEGMGDEGWGMRGWVLSFYCQEMDILFDLVIDIKLVEENDLFDNGKTEPN